MGNISALYVSAFHTACRCTLWMIYDAVVQRCRKLCVSEQCVSLKNRPA